ncbi:4'-phosphopantetheinyl transferase family protein [Pedobacter sp. AW31-3R]|uniref:4'-phosphopantetheinyl transferase family protein n=1 Tax=Pedobacter sp. AW31-3R TaxID=3445781 RepID=UPI003FA14EC4
MIQIYYANYKNKLEDRIYNDYLNSLPQDIRKKILKYRNWSDAQASLYGKLLLQKGLEQLGVDNSLNNLKYTKYGRPYLEGNIDFNISHSGEYVVCAYTDDCRVGVDLEIIKPIQISDFRAQFLAQEWNKITNSSNTLFWFYYYWSAKEAVVKADGRGLSIPLGSFGIADDKTFVAHRLWHLKTINLFDDYILQVASNDVPISIMTNQYHF